MPSKSHNDTPKYTGSFRDPDSAHPRDDDRVRFVNTAQKDRNNRAEGKVLFSHADAYYDSHERHIAPASKVTGHRTTFHSYDIDHDNQEQRKLFDRLWKYQVGRGHTWEERENIVRKDEIWKRCDAILQSCEAHEWEREIALRMTISEDLQGFSRHYAGTDGACVGFALLQMFESTEEAEDSWVAKKAADAVPKFDSSTVKDLVDYVFRKYDSI
jgi:hypothetical protein